MNEIISRSKAIALGLKSYFTGKTCRYGHVSRRNVKSCECMECCNEKKRFWYNETVKPLKQKVKMARPGLYPVERGC
jgi:hypothetical protein